ARREILHVSREESADEERSQTVRRSCARLGRCRERVRKEEASSAAASPAARRGAGDDNSAAASSSAARPARNTRARADRGGDLREKVTRPAEQRAPARRRVLRSRLEPDPERRAADPAEGRRLDETLAVDEGHRRRALRFARQRRIQSGAWQ